MKKNCFFILLEILCIINLSAQTVEKVVSFPISEEFPVYENKNPYEGSSSGIAALTVDENAFYFVNSINGNWYKVENGDNPKIVAIKEGFTYSFPFKCDLPNGFVYGYLRNNEESNKMQLFFKVKGKEYSYIGNSIPDAVDQIYATSNNLFIQTNQKELIDIEFTENGTYKVRNTIETKKWLDNGKGEELGWSQKVSNNKVRYNIFGDINMNQVSTAYSKGVLTKLKMMSAKYEGLTKISELKDYEYLNKDGKGLIYLIKYESSNGPWSIDNPGHNIKFNIAVNDIWTRQVYFYEDFAPNEWNPPRNSEGKIIGSYSWTVAPDGNIYFTDADVEKGEYQIKRIVNRWWEEMGINKRIIGQMNTNHIPLMKAQAGNENDGYCFENDFVWIKEQSSDKKWSRIQKIDGRIGWVETKYIDINTMVPLTNSKTVNTEKKTVVETRNGITIGRIMKATDNLRLRKTELTSSGIITSMLKGTAVKILSFGREETIDGIKSNWVQVEVQSEGKDRDGKSIPEGTRGWCFGGYLK